MAEVYDLIIVGGGPAGISAAIYAARFDLKTLVIDKGLASGALGSSHQVHNFPGLPGPLTGVEILERMRRQAESFGARFLTDKAVGMILKVSPFEVITGTQTHSARAAILATGATGRAPSIPGESAYLGRGVSYCAVCDGAFFRNQAVAVVGNDDEALEEALLLANLASRVYLLAPTSALRASPPLADRAYSHPKIEVRLAAVVQEITGQGEVEGARIRCADGEEFLPVKGIFIFLRGNRPMVDYLAGQVEMLENGCLRVDGDMQTSIPGVFAVGDILCRHLKQAVVAAAEGAMAAISAEKYLRGRAKLRLDWH
jgi:thioredoxin reductase (NADPH)